MNMLLGVVLVVVDKAVTNMNWVVALIAAGGVALGAGLTVLGNIVVGRMNRATQREQLSLVDQQNLRDRAAERLRKTYTDLMLAIAAFEAEPLHAEVYQSLQRQLLNTSAVAMLHPDSDEIVKVLEDAHEKLITGLAGHLAPALEALARSQQLSRSHLQRIEHPIPDLPPKIAL